MGILDALTSLVGGASPEHSSVATALNQEIQEHPGGLDGVLNHLRQNGLGDQVQSWQNPGPNQPVSPDQVQQGMGSSMLNSIATRAGISPAMASGIMAVVLPLVISHMSGNSAQGQSSGMGGGLSGLASSIFGNKS